MQSSASFFCQAAVCSGLYATQKNDNLVTQGSGYSISEIIVSPEPIHYTGIALPDFTFVVSRDGLSTLAARGRLAARVLVVDEDLDGPVPDGALRLPLRSGAKSKGAAMAGLGWLLARVGAFPVERLSERVVAVFGDKAKPSVRALTWGAAQSGTQAADSTKRSM